jgi:hypothetical protein
MGEKPKAIVGPDRRVGDRRHEDLGGPYIEEPKLLYTRAEALVRIVESGIDELQNWGACDFTDLLLNGWRSIPLNKATNRQLADMLQEYDQDDRIRVKG